MRDAVALQHLAMDRREQLRVAQLDRIAKVPWQLAKKIVELIGPLQRIRQVLAAHRLKLEHEAPGMIAKHFGVWPQHAVLE